MSWGPMKHAMALLFLLVGCTVGEVPLGGGGGGDGGGSGSGDGGSNLVCVDRNAAPAAAHAHAGDINDTRGGQSCVVGGCHDPGGAQPFGAAGTLYQADGVTPSAGATIRFFPAGSTTPITSLTDTAGNFHFSAIQVNEGSFPAKTEVTVCPSTRPMVSQVLTSPLIGGNCNSAGCHAPGGATGVIKE
jgi:hypothetical protein